MSNETCLLHGLYILMCSLSAETLSDTSLLALAQKIGKKWKKLGLRLGFSWEKIYSFEVDNNTVQAAVMQMMVEWRDGFEGPHMKKEMEAAMKDTNLSKSKSWEKLDLGKVYNVFCFL